MEHFRSKFDRWKCSIELFAACPYPKTGSHFWATCLFPVQPVGEPAGQLDPDLVLFGGILDPVFKIGIVVDLDHHHAVVRFLEIDAIKSVANAACRAQPVSRTDGGASPSA